MKSGFVPSAAAVDPKAGSIIKKVPGKILPIPAEKTAKIESISLKATDELRELLERQNKILNNKSLVNKLPDKGNRAKELKAKLEEELKSRDEVEKATSLFSEIKLGQLNALEWTHHCSPGEIQCKESSSCHPFHEETDPLKIIASHSGAIAHMKQISFLLPEESLIKPDDLIDSNSAANQISLDLIDKDLKSSNKGSCEDRSLANKSSIPELGTCVRPKPSALDDTHSFASFICRQYGHKESKEKFKLNKPLKPFSGIFPTKPPGKTSSKSQKWVETNVTPPPLIHSNAKLLSLEESIDVQHKQNLQLKEIQIKHAAERLSTLRSTRMPREDIPSGVLDSMSYRHCVSDESESDEEASETELEGQELHDEDQVDRGTTVVYNIES